MGKVIPFTGITRLDIPIDRVLEAAKEELTDVVIIGYDHNGEYYFATSLADGGDLLWLLEKCKQKLMDVDVNMDDGGEDGKD
jgi:hypothetical protein